jgi:hypothetical protein
MPLPPTDGSVFRNHQGSWSPFWSQSSPSSCYAWLVVALASRGRRGMRATRSAAGPYQDLHDRQEHDDEHQRPESRDSETSLPHSRTTWGCGDPSGRKQVGPVRRAGLARLTIDHGRRAHEDGLHGLPHLHAGIGGDQCSELMSGEDPSVLSLAARIPGRRPVRLPRRLLQGITWTAGRPDDRCLVADFAAGL